MAYRAGDLTVEFSSRSNDVVKSINSTTRALSNLSRAIENFNVTQSVFAMQKLEYVFSKIGEATKKIDTNTLVYLSGVGKSLSAISNIGKLEKVDFNKIGQGFTSLAITIKPFLNEVKSAESSLTALYGSLNKFSRKTTSSNGTTDDLTTKFNIGFLYGKMKAISGVARSLANSTLKMLQYGNDYTETLNLWQVAIGDNLVMAEKFVAEMNKAYSVSEKTLMNAQATFKNMLGSLGELSDSMAYTLSEAVTKMAIDYSSLYNVSIDNAITKYQSALAGQVRPIRSISGYDITENTLYELYKELGGTKTVRNLSITEKRLLSIYAIFNQMGKSGALGDMEKTIDNVANQTRMMSENWKQVTTWGGISFQYLLNTSGILKFINTLLIVASEILKSMAYSLGYETPDFANGWADNVEETEKAVNNLTGKLLDFDKIRSMDGGTSDNALGIDEKLLEAISGYNSEIGKSVSATRELANTWLKTLGFVDKNGDGIYEITTRAKTLLEVLKFIGVLIGVILGKAVLNSITKFIKGLAGITTASKALQTVLVAGIIFALLKFIEAIDKGDKKMAIFAGIITGVLVGAFIFFQIQSHKASVSTDKFSQSLKMNNSILGSNATMLGKNANAISSVTFALSALISSYSIVSGIISGLDGKAKKVVSICAIVAGAITSLIALIVALKSTVSWGAALPALLAGIGVAIAGVQGLTEKTIPKYAVGASDIDSGTLFVAGEMGKTEAVYTGSNGKTNVANIQQMQTSFYGALNEWWKSAKGDIPQFKEVSGTGIYEVNKREMKRHGEQYR